MRIEICVTFVLDPTARSVITCLNLGLISLIGAYRRYIIRHKVLTFLATLLMAWLLSSLRLSVCSSICYGHIVAKRCDIGPRLLFIINKKSLSNWLLNDMKIIDLG